MMDTMNLDKKLRKLVKLNIYHPKFVCLIIL